MSAEFVLRPGERADLPQVAEVFLTARRAAFPAMPALTRPEADVRHWVTQWQLDDTDLWLAEDDELLGFALATRTWLDHLYVDPRHAGLGVGSALLGVVQAARPEGFGLWVFESNLVARRFYARHGLAEVRRTDGSANEEQEPDIEMWWPGARVSDSTRPAEAAG